MSSENSIDATTLPSNVFWSLQAAEGWLMLGNTFEPLVELGRIPPEYRSSPAVLAMEWRVNDACGNKEEAWCAAKQLCAALPDCSAAWICQANALRTCQGTQAAADLLMAIVDRFPDQPVIYYNLACYHAQLDQLGAAAEWLLKAFDLDAAGDLKTLALLDPDLKPLWHGIAETFTPSVCEDP